MLPHSTNTATHVLTILKDNLAAYAVFDDDELARITAETAIKRGYELRGQFDALGDLIGLLREELAGSGVAL